jgi:hypothetical protein
MQQNSEERTIIWKRSVAEQSSRFQLTSEHISEGTYSKNGGEAVFEQMKTEFSRIHEIFKTQEVLSTEFSIHS